jgi:hypothetical protein
MIYIYGDGFTFGVDLRLLRYLKIDTNHIKKKIIKKTNLFIEEKDISKDNKFLIQELNNQIRYTPFLYYLNEDFDS